MDLKIIYFFSYMENSTLMIIWINKILVSPDYHHYLNKCEKRKLHIRNFSYTLYNLTCYIQDCISTELQSHEEEGIVTDKYCTYKNTKTVSIKGMSLSVSYIHKWQPVMWEKCWASQLLVSIPQKHTEKLLATTSVLCLPTEITKKKKMTGRWKTLYSTVNKLCYRSYRPLIKVTLHSLQPVTMTGPKQQLNTDTDWGDKTAKTNKQKVGRATMETDRPPEVTNPTCCNVAKTALAKTSWKCHQHLCGLHSNQQAERIHISKFY